MSSIDIQARIGPALVNYAADSTFPDEEFVAAANIEDSALPGALQSLNKAKDELAIEVREISRQSMPYVETWIITARAVHEDIERLRRLANDIVREAEADEQKLELLSDRTTHLQLLERESLFSKRLGDALQSINRVNDDINKAEQAARESNVLEALKLLAATWETIGSLPVSSARAIRLLDDRCFQLKNFVHERLTNVWRKLVRWDKGDQRLLAIISTVENKATSLEDAVTSWKAFQLLEETTTQLWQELDEFIIKPRTDIGGCTLRSFSIIENTVHVGETITDTSIKSLFEDLEKFIRYLTSYLPDGIIKPLSETMMPVLFTRLKEQWLDPAVPSSLQDMGEYQRSLVQVSAFAGTIKSLNWPMADGFDEWSSNAHRIWLSKRKENALDWTRNQLSLGVGIPIVAHHSERKMVTQDSTSDAAQATNADGTDWDAGWDSDDREEPSEEAPSATPGSTSIGSEITNTLTGRPVDEDDDDAADAWGWGDDDATDDPAPDHNLVKATQVIKREETEPKMQEVTLSEPYWTSSIPKEVFDTIMLIYDDGATLAKPENEKVPVAPAAAGLFSIPTQILAMYRAVSPHYYSRNESGNMYTYNDSIWLCDKFSEFVSGWESRQDLTPRTRGLVKLSTEVDKLSSFGKRAYTNELNSQRTVINDFLGGTHNFLDSSRREELEQGIETVVIHIRTISKLWKNVLSYSAWASAVGSLVNAVSKKIISDVFDRDDLGADEANLIAELIVKVTSLDDLFIPDPESLQSPVGKNGTQSEYDNEMDLGTAPLTARFADKWLKMQYLGEVLQSNLANIRFLWFESGLSLEFTKEEVVDLIMLSFENNPQVRGLIKEIKGSEIRETDERW